MLYQWTIFFGDLKFHPKDLPLYVKENIHLASHLSPVPASSFLKPSPLWALPPIGLLQTVVFPRPVGPTPLLRASPGFLPAHGALPAQSITTLMGTEFCTSSRMRHSLLRSRGRDEREREEGRKEVLDILLYFSFLHSLNELTHSVFILMYQAQNQVLKKTCFLLHFCSERKGGRGWGEGERKRDQ